MGWTYKDVTDAPLRELLRMSYTYHIQKYQRTVENNLLVTDTIRSIVGADPLSESIDNSNTNNKKKKSNEDVFNDISSKFNGR